VAVAVASGKSLPWGYGCVAGPTVGAACPPTAVLLLSARSVMAGRFEWEAEEVGDKYVGCKENQEE
jgi:hypothetical protein